MRIQEAAEMSGLSIDTLRFYERKGVLPRPPRQENSYRQYTEDHVATLCFAKGLRDLGLPLQEMGAILAVAHDGTCRDLRARLIESLTEALAALDRRMQELTATREKAEGILQGLRRMRPSDSLVPGTVSCECVRLVEGAPLKAISEAGRSVLPRPSAADI